MLDGLTVEWGLDLEYRESDGTQRNIPRVLFGQFIRADRSEHTCSVKNVSMEGAEFKSAVLPAHDEVLVATLEHLGRLEGRAGYAAENGFMVRWNINPADRTSFLTRLTWLEDYYEGKASDSRQYNRRQFNDTKSVVTLMDGRRIPCEITDLSLSGAGVSINKVPDIGSKIYLGKVLCEVMRHTDEGLGVRFLTGFGSDLMSELLAGESF
jgi:hypothetical protein